MSDTDECDPIIIAGDDAMILAESDGEIRCEYCGHEFDADETAGVFDGSRAYYSCPKCGRTTEGRLPGS